MPIFPSDSRVQWLRAQMLEPHNPSSSSGSATYNLCGLGQVTKPLWVCFLICKAKVAVSFTP